MISGNYIREGGNYRNSFLETLEYDKNGNITKLLRNGDNDAVDYEYVIDELKYDYHPQKPNQLMNVTDESNSPQGFKDGANTGDDYAYDANGNMISDQNKNIEAIRYNHLNLPTKIFFGDGNQIMYLYNATGQKLSKVVQAAEEIRTDYLTGFQYHKEDLNFFPHAEGYVSVVDDKFKYVFNYTDHLDNIRLSYSDANGDNNIQQEEILEESNYYPFGLKHTAYNTNQKKYIRDEELNDLILSFFPSFAGDGRYNYRYQSQEFQDELGLNWYSYKYRNYDPAIGRFMSIDPLTEEYEDYSPYQFSSNQPVHAKELEGLESSNDLNKRDKQEYDPNSFRGKVASFFFNLVVGMGELGATVEGKSANTIEQKLEHVDTGFMFIVDNSLFIEGVMSINRAPSDGETKVNYAKGTTEATTKAESGLIYKVPGEHTESGKPYIGRTKQASPAERGSGATDGRDRTKAKVIDRYDPNKPKQGSYKEQRAINNHGGVKNLDNKRNEMSKKNYDTYEKKQKNGG